MTKKRKPEDGAVLEELQKTVFQNFTAAANSISQLYATADEQQKITFRAGEQHGLEKVRQWIIAKQVEGLPVTEVEIITYVQNELAYTTGDPPVPPISQSNQAPSVDMQMLTSDTSVQNLQIPQDAKQTKIFRAVRAPTSPVRGSPSLYVPQGEFFGEINLQVPQIGDNQMPAGNCLPFALAQLDHLTQERDLSDAFDSEMDMNMDEHP